MGEVYQAQGQYDQALNYFQQALVIARDIGDRAGEGTTLNNTPSMAWLTSTLCGERHWPSHWRSISGPTPFRSGSNA